MTSRGTVTDVFDEVMTNRVPYCGITRSRGCFTFLSVGPVMGNRALMVPGHRISCVFSLRSSRLTNLRLFTGGITGTLGATFPYRHVNVTILNVRIPRARVRLVPLRGRDSVLFDGPGLALASRRFIRVTTGVRTTV